MGKRLVSKPVQRRKVEFIDPEVQGALARRMSIHWLLFTVLASVLVVGLKWLTNPFTPITEHLYEAWWTYGPMLLVLICLAPVFVYDAIKLSNKFTGPMLRFRNATRAVARGEDPGRIKLRTGDFWQGVANDFNQMVERLKSEKPLSGPPSERVSD